MNFQRFPGSCIPWSMLAIDIWTFSVCSYVQISLPFHLKANFSSYIMSSGILAVCIHSLCQIVYGPFYNSSALFMWYLRIFWIVEAVFLIKGDTFPQENIDIIENFSGSLYSRYWKAKTQSAFWLNNIGTWKSFREPIMSHLCDVLFSEIFVWRKSAQFQSFPTHQIFD